MGVRRKYGAVLLGAVVFLVGACGGSGSGDDSTTTTQSLASESITTIQGVGTTSGPTSTTISRPAEESTSSNDAADPGRLCEILTEVDQLGIEDREVVAESRSLLDEALRVAPEEIRPSLEISVDALMVLYDAAEAADFDFEQMELPDEFLDPSSEVAAAGVAIDVWIGANCSTATGDPTSRNEYAGEWVGETSQGEPLMFVIGDGGGFLQFGVGWSGTDCDEFSPFGMSTSNPTDFVTGDAIGLRMGGLVVVTVEGNFDSTDSAAGTVEISSASGCGDPLTLDWSAHR